MYWHNKRQLIKVLFFIVGVFINSLGIVLITKSNMGTSQISSISYVVSLKFQQIDFGMATFLLNVVFLIVQMAILRKKIDIKIILQLPASFILGYFISVNMNILDVINLTTFLSKVICLLIGCVILALGISVEIAPDIVKIPGEGIVFTISKEMDIRFGKVKVIFDLILVITALLISIVSFNGVKGIGIGTGVSALVVGKMFNVFDMCLRGFYCKYLK